MWCLLRVICQFLGLQGFGSLLCRYPVISALWFHHWAIYQQAEKFAAFCSRQGYVSFPASEHTVYEYLAFWSLEGAVKPQLLPSYIAVSEYVTHPWDLGINANSVAGVRPMFQLC